LISTAQTEPGRTRARATARLLTIISAGEFGRRL